jgi:hypothetical protein
MGGGTCTWKGNIKNTYKILIGKSARIISSWKINIEIFPEEGA